MNAYQRLLARFRAVSEPVDASNLRARVLDSLDPDLARPSPWPKLVVVASTLAVAAVAAFALLPRNGPVSAHLEAASDVHQDLTPEVKLDFSGQGEVTGTRRAPVIAWEAGRVDVDVTPHQGIDLSVETGEATVRVVGTAFTVDRDRLGTKVEVARGVVQVACKDGEISRLEAGDSVVCLPTRPAGLLGRARALQAANAPADEILDTIGRGLRSGADGAVKAELMALEVAVLANAGRDDDALASADRYVAAGDPLRLAEVRRLAARVGLRHGGCGVALPWLRAQADDQPTVDDLVAFAGCASGDEAKTALERALTLGPTDEQAAVIRERLAAPKIP